MMTNPVRKITQGQFSFLPELTDAEISLQIKSNADRGVFSTLRRLLSISRERRLSHYHRGKFPTGKRRSELQDSAVASVGNPQIPAMIKVDKFIFV